LAVGDNFFYGEFSVCKLASGSFGERQDGGPRYEAALEGSSVYQSYRGVGNSLIVADN
jgi:hypothetical protein